MNLPLPSAGNVDPWPEIVALVPQKITYKGAPAAGSPEQIKGFAKWLFGQLPAVVSEGDEEHKANCFLHWLRSETRYEADTATRMAQAAAVAQAPTNPISTQTAPQQAAPVAPPAPPAAPAEGGEAAEGPTMACLECGAAAKNMTGLKRHLTMTHKIDWGAYCQKHGLDAKTGLKGGAPVAPPAQPAAPAQPPPPPAAPSVPPMFGAPGQATQAPPFAAPAPPPQPPPFAAPAPPPQPPQQTIPFSPPAQAPSMPAPPAQVPAQSIPMTGQAVPSFQPPAFASPPPATPAPTIPPASPPMVAYNPTPAPAPAPAPQVTPGAPSREMLAQMLGGAVQLTIVKLLDAATFKLDGLVDVNQLAALAESRARQEMKVADLAQASYGQGKQAAQRHFAELLNQSPSCYLLLNGYEPILPAGYLEILAARVTRFTVVTDGGRQVNTIF